MSTRTASSMGSASITVVASSCGLVPIFPLIPTRAGGRGLVGTKGDFFDFSEGAVVVGVSAVVVEEDEAGKGKKEEDRGGRGCELNGETKAATAASKSSLEGFFDLVVAYRTPESSGRDFASERVGSEVAETEVEDVEFTGGEVLGLACG